MIILTDKEQTTAIIQRRALNVLQKAENEEVHTGAKTFILPVFVFFVLFFFFGVSLKWSFYEVQFMKFPRCL